MKLISMKCPNCGAVLEVNADLKEYKCNYCGVTTILDDEIITVKHVNSKLADNINEVREYYDNGNYDKSVELLSVLLNEYPENKEIHDLYTSSRIKKARIFAQSILDKKYFIPVINGLYEMDEINNDKALLSSYGDLIKDDEIAQKAFEKINKKIKECNEKNAKANDDSIMNIIIIFVVAFIITIFICLIVWAPSEKAVQEAKNITITTVTSKYDSILRCSLDGSNFGKRYTIGFVDGKMVRAGIAETEQREDAKQQYELNSVEIKKYNSYKGMSASASYSGNLSTISKTFYIDDLDDNAKILYDSIFGNIKGTDLNEAKRILEANKYTCNIEIK